MRRMKRGCGGCKTQGMLGCRDAGEDAKNAREVVPGRFLRPRGGASAEDPIVIGRPSHGDVLHSHACAEAPSTQPRKRPSLAQSS